MKGFWPLLAGVTLCIGASALGLVLVPRIQLGDLKPVSGYPKPLSPLAAEGRRVYVAEGCAACHTQQLRPIDVAPATNRGWGDRRTVARDYLNDEPHLLGTMRIGPDLTNIGHRRPEAAWHQLHLFNPRSVVPASTMPAYPALFEMKENAVVTGGPPAPPGFHLAPTHEGEALIAYLLSLDRSTPLPEADAP